MEPAATRPLEKEGKSGGLEEQNCTRGAEVSCGVSGV